MKRVQLLLIFCNFDFWYTVVDNFPSYTPQSTTMWKFLIYNYMTLFSAH